MQVCFAADKTIKDANGNSPLSWASEHLRPGVILSDGYPNIEPKPAKEHIQLHKDKGDLKRWGARNK